MIQCECGNIESTLGLGAKNLYGPENLKNAKNEIAPRCFYVTSSFLNVHKNV